MLPRRVAGGATLAQSHHDAWQKLPVSSTVPTKHLRKRDDGTASISIACQVYPWQQAVKVKQVAAERAPLQKILRICTCRDICPLPLAYKRRGGATVQRVGQSIR